MYCHSDKYPSSYFFRCLRSTTGARSLGTVTAFGAKAIRCAILGRAAYGRYNLSSRPASPARCKPVVSSYLVERVLYVPSWQLRHCVYLLFRLRMNVTTASGTSPTLAVVVEDSIDGGATWNTIGSFAQKTAAGREVINITEPFADTVRARWTISGTAPNFAFDLRAYVQ
jgi:hypothetical protein